MTYTRYNHQGYFGESFVRALVSAAGLIAGQQDVDHTGVDFSIDFPGTRGTARFPKIAAQVKSWSSPKGTAAHWHYPMDVNNYNNLAGQGFSVPRYLFLVIVPADVREFAHVDETSMRLSYCGYWASLHDHSDALTCANGAADRPFWTRRAPGALECWRRVVTQGEKISEFGYPE